MAQAVLTARIDAQDKLAFDSFCKDVGLSASAAINLYVKAVIRQRAIPFSISQGEDPFYSEANMSRLRKAVSDVKSGKATLTAHELIEVSDD